MLVQINFKICDNSKDCSGITVCPTGALYWDADSRTLMIDDMRCVVCGECQSACPVGAIRVAVNEDEFEEIRREIEKDPRKVSDLFVDRYGAEPLDPAFLISQRSFTVHVLEATKLTVVELFNWETVQCLFHSIPIRELFKGMDVKYRKMQIDGDSILSSYGVETLPAFLFFNGGRLLGKIEGYFPDTEKDELGRRIRELLISSGLQSVEAAPDLADAPNAGVAT